MHEYSSKGRQNLFNVDQPLLNGRRSYNFQNIKKSVHLSQTDKRIQEIKRKYDTPNRRQRLSQISVKKSDLGNKQNQNYGTADFRTKSFIYPACQTQGNQPNPRQSKVIANSRQKFYNNAASSSKHTLPDKALRERESYVPKMPTNKLYKNQNQQEFFKRANEMKQSLLYGDNPSKPTETKASTFVLTKQSRTKSGFYDSNQNVEKDRIDNIDKINQKIKGILECLNENQRTRIPSSKYDLQKRNKIQDNRSLQQQLNSRQMARTPAKSALSTSIMGRSSFGNHRQQRSEILEKIQVNRDCKDDRVKKQMNNEQGKWQKLSTKLQKYEFDNKARIQNAFDLTKQVKKQTLEASKVIQNSRNNNRSYYQPQNQYVKPVQNVKRDNRSVDFRDLRARSFLYQNAEQNSRQIRERERSLYTRDPNGAKQHQMKSGKKIDDQIDRIQRKIQQFQEQKKRLNISFKPFNYSNSKSTSNLALHNVRPDSSTKNITQFTKSLYKNEKDGKQQEKYQEGKIQEKVQNQSTFREKKQSFGQNVDENLTEHRLNNKIQIKLQKSNLSSVRTSKFISQNSSRISNNKDQQQSYAVQQQTKQDIQIKSRDKQFNYFFDESLKRQTDEGIEQRRKKLMNYSDNSRPKNVQLKNLVKFLCEQVRLDQEFRNAKIWFQYSDDPQKYKRIKILIPQKSDSQIKEILKVRQSQNNPFFTTQGYESSFSKLADLYSQSHNHWNDNLYKKFDSNLLEGQGFTCKEIDLQKKGNINLGDLVRFLNLESGTFYRNRDLALVFIRICRQYNSSSFTQISFEWLLQTFCL